MTREMLDTNRPGLLPSLSADLFAGYVDGSYQWTPDDWQRFPAHHRVGITVEPFDPGYRPTGYPFGDWREASVIDVERGAFRIGQAARFVPARNGFRPGTATVYISQGRLGALLSAARGQSYWLWLAWWLDHEPTPAEVAAIEAEIRPYGVRLAAWQWKNGPDYDTSLVVADQWHKAPR